MNSVEHPADTRLAFRQCVIVAGMHRSGTSAVTRVVNLLGADVASELLPSKADNERGFWESPVVNDIHDRLLEALGSNWHDPFPLPHDWIGAGATQHARRHLAAEIEKDFADSRLFVVKDPRITRLLPMWLEILDDLAIEPVVVIPVRNPLEIAASLEVRDRFPPAKSLLLYAHGCLETELGSRSRRRFFVRYEQLLDDWRPFAARLAEAAGSHLLAPRAEQADAIDRFLTAGLRHHCYGRADLSETRDIAAIVVDIFDRMSEASDSGDETELRQSFDRLRETLAEAARLYRGLVMAERAKAEEERTRLQGEQDARLRLEAELGSALAQAAERNAAAAARAAEVTRLQGELGSARVQAAEWHAASAAQAAEVTRLQGELGSACERAASVAAELAVMRDQASAQAARLRAELATASRRAVLSESVAAALGDELDAIKRSSIWRVTGPLRLMGARLPRIRRRVRQILKLIRWTATSRLSPADPLKRFWRGGLNRVRRTAARLVPSRCGVPERTDRYCAWLACNASNTRALQALRDGLSARRGQLPRISVVMPVYNTPAALLDQAIGSVCHQIHQDWELCIADDGSTDPGVAPVLRRWAAADRRIRITTCASNGGIAAATNAAAALATGEFLAFVDHDDLLAADALAEVAIFAADHPHSDVIYSDDDKIDMNGRRFSPQFKPGWSPTLLLSYMYLGHLLVVRRSLFAKAGGIRSGFDGSQDYDFALRACELARHVGHIPRILYHWRVAPGSVAVSTDAKPDSLAAGERAVRDAFARRDTNAIIAQPGWAKAGKVGIYAARFADDGPRVAILIPTHNRVELLRTCVASLRRTTYRNYEVVILDNDSDDPETLRFLADCGHRVLRVPRPGGNFSFAHVNNVGVSQVEAEYVLLLNNDTEVIEPRWLSQMIGYARMPGVGAVGAKLLFRDATVQHNGIVHGYHDGTAGHAFKNMPADTAGYLWYLKVPRECSGVTAACLLTPRALFLEHGGLDEKAYSVAYNDVDYCCRLVDHGYRCVICPEATLYHDEGKSRGFEDNPAELAALRRRYRGRIDPYYSPNLSLDNEHFEIRPYRHPSPDGAPVRVVAVSHSLNHEGAPNSQFEMTLGLKRGGVIDPVVLSPQDGPLRSAYEAAGIPVEIIAPPDTGGAGEFRLAIRKLARAIRESGADVVYANTLQTFWAIATAEAAGLPAIWNVRESEDWRTYFDFLVPDVRTIAYGSFCYPYRVVFVAHATRNGWEALNSHHNFTVIHNGLDIGRLRLRGAAHDREAARARLKISGPELAVVLVGTVCERKGQLDLVRALGLLGEDGVSRLRVFIVGDRASPYSSRLHAEAQTLPASLAARLTIVPETGDPYEYFRAADIAVCCSRLESYPRVTLEAMAFGLPLITTPVFGIAEQVRENMNGLFYQPGDAAQLAARLASLAADDALRARLGANSFPVLDSLPDFEDMLDGYGRLFREARLSGDEKAAVPVATVEAPGLSPCAG